MDIWLDRARSLIERLPIKDIETHRMVPFKFNRNQARRFEMIREQWETEGKLRILDLKSRRVGVSAQTDALLWTYAMAFANMNVKIVAHLTNSAEELFRVPSDLSKAFPNFQASDIQMKRLFFPHPGGQSQITLATAGTPAAGRGGTLSALHLSEAAYFPSDDSFVSMITSVSKGPGSIVVIESTANGREGPGQAFFEYWEAAVAGRNGYLPIFLCWLDDPNCIRPEEEADDAPQDDLEKELMGKPFNATREQIAWMRRTKADDCRNIEFKWLTDYPHHPSVAFQISGEPAFPREELNYAATTIQDEKYRGRFVRLGPGHNFKFTQDDNGPWLIWKWPFDDHGRNDGLRYYGGADAALGTEEGDFAAICILCGQTGELAARFSERVPPEELANQMDMAGRNYNIAMMNPELTGNLGRWALIKLRDQYKYPNIYTWKGRDDRKRGRAKSSALGFEMNQATRRLIVDACRNGLRMGLRGEPGALVLNDRALLEQISLCTLKEWRWEVERGHDDIAVAFFIACLTREQYPPTRMSFAPKNTMDEEQLKEDHLRIAGVKTQPSELDQIFYREMRKIRIAAGLKPDMRGVGKRRTIDRLYGI
jgi:hypothetical protein